MTRLFNQYQGIMAFILSIIFDNYYLIYDFESSFMQATAGRQQLQPPETTKMTPLTG